MVDYKYNSMWFDAASVAPVALMLCGVAELGAPFWHLCCLRWMKKEKNNDREIVVNLNNYGNSYGVVHRAMQRKGWKIAKKQVRILQPTSLRSLSQGEFWDVGWSDSNKVVQAVQKMADNHRYLSPVQRINHFPGRPRCGAGPNESWAGSQQAHIQEGLAGQEPECYGRAAC